MLISLLVEHKNNFIFFTLTIKGFLEIPSKLNSYIARRAHTCTFLATLSVCWSSPDHAASLIALLIYLQKGNVKADAFWQSESIGSNL